MQWISNHSLTLNGEFIETIDFLYLTPNYLTIYLVSHDDFTSILLFLLNLILHTIFLVAQQLWG